MISFARAVVDYMSVARIDEVKLLDVSSCSWQLASLFFPRKRWTGSRTIN
jgi:hypothetical protein